jgi:hypothetical protein
MRVTFQANALGAGGLNPGAVVNLNIGTGSFGNIAADFGSNILSFNNASTTITVVPEPGTALLMGLGLVGLASRRR